MHKDVLMPWTKLLGLPFRTHLPVTAVACVRACWTIVPVPVHAGSWPLGQQLQGCLWHPLRSTPGSHLRASKSEFCFSLVRQVAQLLDCHLLDCHAPASKPCSALT